MPYLFWIVLPFAMWDMFACPPATQEARTAQPVKSER
jgi:hypothetical protein